MADLADIIQRENDEYKARIKPLQFFMESYEGGDKYVHGGRIFRHQRENDADYADRIKRPGFLNFCAPIIDIFLGHIYREPIPRLSESQADDYALFAENVDGAGCGIRRFMKEEVGLRAQVYGHSFVLVARPALDPELHRSLADVIDAGLQYPVFSSIDPTCVTAWQFVKGTSRLEYLRYRDVFWESSWNGMPKKQTWYWTWTQSEVFVHRVVESERGKQTVVEVPEHSGEHGLNEVPIVAFYNRKSKQRQMGGVSAIEDIAAINRSVLNVYSLIDEFLYRQCFNILAVPLSAMLEGDQKISTSGVIPFNAEDGKPEYLFPATDPAQFMMTWLQELISQIFRMAKIRDDVRTAEAESGESKMWDFTKTNQSLAEKADNLAEGEREMWRLWQAYQKNEFDFQIEYPTSFNVRAINEELQNALGVQGLQLSESFKSIYNKKLMRRLDERLTVDQLDQIDAEQDAIAAANQQLLADDAELNSLTVTGNASGGTQ